MWLYIGRRIAHGLALIAVIMVATFFVFQVIGDPVRRILPTNSTEEQIKTYREENGFADPLGARLGRFSRDVVTLDFGSSYVTRQPALGAVFDALPKTVALATASLLLAVALGLTIGSVAGLNRGGRLDQALVAFSVSLVSLAEFWVGIILITVVAVKLRLLPTSGYGLDDRVILPALTLAILPTGRLAFFVRNSIAEALDMQHVLFATAMGLPRRTILRAHVLRNVAVPILALGGMEATRMLVGGAVIVETVFAWPGIGRLYVIAMRRYDLPLVTATLFIATIIVLALNIILDVLYARLDPRVRFA